MYSSIKFNLGEIFVLILIIPASLFILIIVCSFPIFDFLFTQNRVSYAGKTFQLF